MKTTFPKLQRTWQQISGQTRIRARPMNKHPDIFGFQKARVLKYIWED